MYRACSYIFFHPSAFASGCAGIHELPLSNIEAGQIHTRVADEAQIQVCWHQKLLACASGTGMFGRMPSGKLTEHMENHHQ